MMKIEVKRTRGSVTQGMAYVYINDKEIMAFGDTIEMVKQDQKYYGEIIGGFASITPDSAFINGLFYHPLDSVYHFSEIAKKAIKEADQN